MAAIATNTAQRQLEISVRRRRARGIVFSYPTMLVRTLVCAYPLLLILTLKEVISPVFSYARYWYLPPDSLGAAVAVWVLAVIPGMILPQSSRRPSTASLWIMYFLVYAPAIILPIYASGRSVSSYYTFQMALLAGFLIAYAISSLPPIRIPTLKLPSIVFWGFMACFTLMTFALVITKYGLPTRVPSLMDVYDVRADYAEESAGQSRILTYLISWQGKVVNPFLLAYGLVGRKPTFAVMGVAGQVTLYSLAGHKSVLFSTVLVLALFIAYWRGGRALGAVMSGGIFLVVIGSVAIDRVMSTIVWSSLAVRRLIMTPGILTGYYYEFFSVHEKTASFGPLSRFFGEYPYDLSVPYLIGREVLGREDMSANANLWAGGYSSFGVTGVIFFSAILGTVLLLFNSLAATKGYALSALLAGVAVFSLTNSSLMTSLGTHGILFALLVLWLVPRPLAAVGSSGKEVDRATARRGRRTIGARRMRSRRKSSWHDREI